MIDWMTSATASALSQTLLHFLWQGVLIGLFYWLALAIFDVKSALNRYRIAMSALVMMAVCPIVTFNFIHAASVDELTVQTPVETIDVGFEASSAINAAANIEQLSDGPGKLQHAEDIKAPWIPTLLNPCILALWFTGVILSGTRLAAGFWNVFWLRFERSQIPWELHQQSRVIARRLRISSVPVFGSQRVHVAAVVGFWKPVILLPVSWLTELPSDVLQAVIAHEMAHIQRLDIWGNLFQRFVETLLFYHPVVWWISNRIRFERELCCDEQAAEATGDCGNYAMALEQVGRLEVRGVPRLTPAITGDKQMNLLRRVENILGMSKPQREPAWVVGLLTMVSALLFVGVMGTLSATNQAVAQDREGGRSPEAEAGPRRSPEAEAGPRRSAEAEAGPRRSAEAEAGPRRPAEGERGARRPAEGDGAESMRGFRPQTEREEALFKMIMQLQREVAALRREIQPQDARDGDRAPERGASRTDAAVTAEDFELPANWRNTKEGKVFLAYDKDRDDIVSLEEWIAMTNGNLSDERRAISTKHFNDAEPSGDGKFTPAEFIWWRSIGSKQAVGRARDGDREGARRGPRDGEGEGARRGPRDGEGKGARLGPRDGEGVRRGPRDGE